MAVLRAELAARDLIRGTPPPAYAYGPLTDADEVQKCVKLARAYVDDGTVPPVITVGQVRAVYAALRDLCSQAPPAATPAAPPSETPMKQSRRLFATPLASPPPPTEQLTSSNLEAHQSMTNEELFKRWRSSTNDQEVIDVEEDLRACASRKKELKTLSKKLVTDVNDAKTRIDEELQRYRRRAARTSSATTPKQRMRWRPRKLGMRSASTVRRSKRGSRPRWSSCTSTRGGNICSDYS